MMVQAEWHEDVQVLCVWCIIWWWLGWSTAGLHSGIQDWHWAGLVYQPNQWFLTAWMWHLMPHLSSVLLLKIAAHRTGWPSLGQSLLLLLSQICHLGQYLPQLAPARHVGWCSSPIFSRDHLYFQPIPIPGQSGVGFLTGVWDGEWKGALPNTSVLFRAIWAAWWCEGVVLSLEVNSRLLII